MKKIIYFLIMIPLLVGCSNDDDNIMMTDDGPMGTGESMSFDLSTNFDSNVTGTATVEKNTDGSSTVTLSLNGDVSGGHPAHIHVNSAAEGGEIAMSLEPVDASGMSKTVITSLDNGSAITYEELISFDGYINVHQSAADLATLIVQGDIGTNDLTGDTKMYSLFTKAVDGIDGSATFSKRVDGSTLVTLMLDGTPDDGEHPAHIHFNTAAEGGDIAVSLNAVAGVTGMSYTQVEATTGGDALTYDDLLSFDGYINVHASAADLATLVAQGDIGQNELTGDTKAYALGSVAVDDISGQAMFSKRVNGTTLVTLMLDGTPADGEHPAHIHFNTAAEGGGIAVTLNSVVGASGMSYTQVEATNDGDALTYDDLLDFDGYINVHLSAADLATLVAQGDIGQNELTGDTKAYALGTVDVEGISGEAKFSKRVNGTTLVTLMLDGTPADGEHPAHIHVNTAAEGGGIAVTLSSVVGATGMSKTQVEATNDGDALTYDDLLDFDGYINVHASAADLGTLVAQGDIGQNELTGESQEYSLGTVDVPGISGSILFEERVNGEALATIDLSGTITGGDHPAHIHAGSVANAPGDILITLSSVVGASGMSKTNISAYNNGDAINYDQLIAIDGYVNVHNSVSDLATLIAQGNVGVNAD